MKWKRPPVIKIYEALGAVADGRVEVAGNTAKVYSSSGNKFYEVVYDPEQNAIMANDNGSYWRGYLGYPAIAFLLKIGVLSYKDDLANLLKSIKWKDINQKFKNDFDKTLAHIEELMTEEQRKELWNYVREVDGKIVALDLNFLGPKQKPPAQY